MQKIKEVKYNITKVIEYNKNNSTGETKMEINTRVSTLFNKLLIISYY